MTNSVKETSEVVDVVVVGGGPVGLWLAAEARLGGASVVLVERRVERVRQSRALTIHGRTLETFGLRGLSSRFLEVGRPMPTWHFASLDTRLDFSGFDTPYPFTLFIPQSLTEAILEDHAVEAGVDVRRGAVVVGIEDRGDQVDVALEDGGVISSRWVVGSDGARSIVRRTADIDFPGLAATESIAMGDVVLDLPDGAPLGGGQNEFGGASIIPSGDGVHSRVIVLDTTRRHVPQNEPLTLEELRESLRRTTGTDFGARDASWLTRFTNETRLASSYRKGRLLLAGDAAHIHAPMGGQGLNVGVQDAMNLGWKLALVATDRAPEGLLETYESERRPVGERLFANTAAQYKLASDFSPANRYLRDVVSGLLAVPEANRVMAGEVSGFSVSYPQPLVADSEPTSGAGRRTPDLPLTDGSTLHHALAEGKFVRVTTPGDRAIPLPAAFRQVPVLDVRAERLDIDDVPAAGSIIVRPDGYTLAGSGADATPRSRPSVSIQRLNPEDLHGAPGFISQIVQARGSLAFLAGQVAQRADGTWVGLGSHREQAEQIARNIDTALRALDLRRDAIVKETIYVVDYSPALLRDIVGPLRDSYTAPPASTLVGVDTLFAAEALIEVEVTVAVEA
ncbi:FAD-dependent monooxygenase [Leifsonia sp. ZF2019]|uniref:FAD-dependent monooxygenase n=1 Tax=Leifsonia sp. ZF2019 TaxID=2781978 RepID=UPI001CBBA0CD|nr:FAD-dependent monooxygenase [Leifsonia sp. ZF2019]UAJ78845.1 FAD-dependent monooxygenase [Leifsonia sp. ZF2019]